MLTKTPSLFAIGLAASFFLLGQPNLKAAEQGPAKFDGSWKVTVDTKEYKNPDGSTAKEWIINFPATVKNGVFHGEHGTRGKPAFYELDGKIGPDGAASLVVNEITGSQKYNFSAGTKAPAHKGVSYSYQVAAKFDSQHGTGKSTSDPRTRIFIFAKQG
jgi:hypothetical protein